MAATRSIKDYIQDAFFARDKASLAAIVKDAEENPFAKGDNGDDDEGDEGDDNSGHATGKPAVVIHNHHSADDTSVAGRVQKLEDGMKSLDAKVSKVLDAISKDDDNPFAKDPDEGDGNGDDEEDPEPTEDETLSTTGAATAGAATAQALSDPEPDLMSADPAKSQPSSKMGDAMKKLIKDTIGRAEVLAPGMTMPAHDSIAEKGAVCKLRRAALRRSGSNDAAKAAMKYVTGDMLKTMSCDGIRVLFLTASDAVRQANNTKSKPQGGFTGDARAMNLQHTERLKEINKANRDFWNAQTGRAN